MPEKVLFITRKWPPAVGGMETYCLELTNALRRHETVEQLEIIALPGREDGSVPSGLAILGFGFHALWQLIGKARTVSIVHGGDMAIWPLLWIASVLNSKVTLVLSAHGTDVAFANRSGFRARLYRFYLRLGAKFLKKPSVIANSNATAILLEGHGFDNPYVIPLGAHCRLSETSNEGPGSYVLFVGRLIRRKGCRWFIDQVLPLLPTHMTLKVAGVVVDQDEEQVLSNDRVSFLGPVFGDDLDELRRRAIAVVVPNISDFPNSFEGFGLTTIEAASAGGVVVASSIDGIKDAIADGKTGFLLEPQDSQSWAEKIRDIESWSARKRQSFVDKALHTIATEYSWHRVADETANLYQTSEKDEAIAA